MLERVFRLRERGTDARTEVLAGVTTFLTMAYIVFVNPLILSFSGDPSLAGKGLPLTATATATALTAGVLSIAMGLVSNFPLALAAGMGLNAVVGYQLVLDEGLSFPSAMGVVVLEGAAITLLVLTGVRSALVDAIPVVLKKSVAAGIGLFLAFIGFVQAGLVRRSETTLVTLGRFDSWPVLVSVLGLVFTGVLLARRVRGGLLLGILGTTLLALLVNGATGGRAFPPGTAVLPDRLLTKPDFSTFGAFDFGVFSGRSLAHALLLVFSLMLVDFFDTMGTILAVGSRARLLDPHGRPIGLGRILLVDSLGAVAGGAASASSNTSYVESASGAAVGGRTGLMAVVTGLLFLACLFVSPLVAVVPKEATAPALILVGFLMAGHLAEIDFEDLPTALPAFLVAIGIPLTYRISSGIGFGLIAWSLLHLMTGRAREVHPLLHVAAGAFLLDFLGPLLLGS